MKFILADNQDATRIGMHYIIQKTFDQTVHISRATDRTTLLNHLDDDVTAVVIDPTSLNFISQDELLEMSNRHPSAIWIIFENDITEPTARNYSSNPRFSLILKHSHVDEIRSALKYSTIGERFVCQSITNQLLTPASQHKTPETTLTQTEIEVLRLTAQGLSVKEIALQRNSSIHTITTHKRNIFRKLNINTSYEAMRYAVKAGLVDFIEYYI